MKCVFSLIILICLFGCGSRNNKNQLSNMKTNVIDEGIELSYNFITDNLSKKDIIRCGILIKLHDVTNINLTLNDNDEIIDSTCVKDNCFTITYKPSQNNYNKIISIRSFITYNDSKNNTQIIYQDNIDKINFYTLCKGLKNNFAKEVVAFVDGKLISEIDLKIDTKRYEVISTHDNLQVEIDYNYQVVTITMTINQNFYLAKNLSLTVNDKIIDDYEVKSNQIIYQFDDPNWTKPY